MTHASNNKKNKTKNGNNKIIKNQNKNKTKKSLLHHRHMYLLKMIIIAEME